MDCLEEIKKKTYVSENEKSILVYDQNTGEMIYSKDKNDLDKIYEKIVKQEEVKSLFVKEEKNVFKLNLSTLCNMNCDYCFRDKDNISKTDVAKTKKIIDFIMDKYSPHVDHYSFSVNLTSESLIELNKIKEIKQYLDERTSHLFRVEDFKSLEHAQKYLDCFPEELILQEKDKCSELNSKEAFVKLLNSFLVRKDMVSFFPMPEGMQLPSWEAEQYKNLKSLDDEHLLEFNLRFLECLFPETFFRKPYYVFYICTNGTTFSQEVVDFLKDIKLDTLCISLDGPSAVHNLHRVFCDEKSTHKIILENIKRYMAAGFKISVAAVLTKDYPYPLLLTEYFKELGVTSIGMTPVRTGTACSFDEESIDLLLKGYEKLFDRIFEDVLKNDYSLVDLLKDDTIFSGTKMLLLKNRIVKRCKWNEDTIFDGEGNIYPCDYFIGNRKYLRGSINSVEVKDVFDDKLSVDDREKCRECWCKYLCGGTCYYNSLKNMKDISVPDSVECRFNKQMRVLSLGFVQKLIDSGIDLYEFGKKLGFEIDEEVQFGEHYVVENGLVYSFAGTLSKVELELSRLFSDLERKGVSFSRKVFLVVKNVIRETKVEVLDLDVVVPILEDNFDLKDYAKNGISFVRKLDFGKCISGKVGSSKEVETLRGKIDFTIGRYSIPVSGLYWYFAEPKAFLGYKEDEISVFMPRQENTY
ncbi:MAG: SPASM domain-containing protein [Treponema sp.]|nr:SPASM domain-containing protein [Treponema sp.]